MPLLAPNRGLKGNPECMENVNVDKHAVLGMRSGQ